MIHYGSLNETTQQNKDHFMEKVIRFLIRDGLVVVSYLVFKYVAIVAFNYAACNQVILTIIYKNSSKFNVSN